MKAGLEMDVALVDPGTIEPHLEWSEVVDAIRSGHALPRAIIADNLVQRGDDGLLLRSAWIDGLGSVVKCATVFPGNDDRGIPTIHGSVTLFDDRTGIPEAFLDFHQVTRWKTAADSLLGAQLLARKDSRSVLIVGAGTVARSLVPAYASHFRGIRFMVWNRTIARAEDMRAECSSTGGHRGCHEHRGCGWRGRHHLLRNHVGETGPVRPMVETRAAPRSDRILPARYA